VVIAMASSIAGPVSSKPSSKLAMSTTWVAA
jgi:hypothetical protein